MSTNIAPSRAKTVSKRGQTPRNERKSLQATAVVRKAIELMVWEGHRRDDAAKAVGMLPKSLYNAFRKHHVRRFYREQLQVLRTSEMARNVHALVRIRDQDANKLAAVAAVKALEKMNDNDMTPPVGRQITPGLTIIIEQAAPPAAPRPVIEATALPSHE
jgi:hypothetical protein